MLFITYDKLNKYLYELTNNNYKNKVTKHPAIAFSPCGFPIEHYSIGHGHKHLVVIAGTHGTEIIGIDFVLKLMKAIAQGTGIYKDFAQNEITIDFIPCQNPESFIIVTESLKQYINEQNFQKISYEYYLNYRKDDIIYTKVNEFFKSLTQDKKVINNFWDEFRQKNISSSDLEQLLNNHQINKNKIINLFDELKKLNIIDDNVIPKEKFHYSMFPNLNYKNLPEIDNRYIKLKNKIQKIMETNYDNYKFPKQSIIDWRANSNGVDLNKNNPKNFKFKNKEKENNNFKPLFGKLRFNSLMREVPGPQGTSSVNNQKFSFEPENLGLLKLLLNLKKDDKYAGVLSYHGTGGVIYFRPKNYLEEKDLKKAKLLKEIDEINTNMAKAYQIYTGYKEMPYEQNPIGTGDMIRQILPGFLIIELSKMGGNPLGPYGDKDNYQKLINDNIIALNSLIKLIQNKTKIK